MNSTRALPVQKNIWWTQAIYTFCFKVVSTIHIVYFAIYLQLLYYLKRVNFTNQFEEKVYFDGNGEPVPVYDIINWQKDGQGGIRFHRVGSYDGSASPGEQLKMDMDLIEWTGGKSQVFSLKK